jgi:GMP synthase (glutamine-hydrolysing)
MTSPTTMTPHRFCIVNCYPAASRENFDRSDVGHPHDLFRDFLRREAPNATTEIVYVADPGFALPPGTSIDDFDGFIWTGSDLTVYHTDDPRVAAQIAFARALAEAGAVAWGSCWGIQLASLVAGGEVAVNPRGREWGIARDIRLTDAAQTSPMHAGKPVQFDAFIMHLDEVTRLPEGTPLLAGNAHTHVQAAIIEIGGASFWCTQYHPEYNLHEMGRLIAARAAALVREGHFPDEAAVTAYAARMKDLAANPDSVELRTELDVGDDIIDPRIREIELRNWLRFVDSRARLTERPSDLARPETQRREASAPKPT